MESPDQKVNLIELLTKCGEAHHTYEEGEMAGKKDEQWPQWYAKYLLDNGLNEMFEEDIDPEDLQETLVAAARKHQEQEDGEEGDEAMSWNEIYADFIMYQFT